MITAKDIYHFLESLNINPGDTIMIHGDAIVTAQLTNISQDQRVNFLIQTIISYMGENGTIIFPTFTYSFTKSEDFDVQLSPSKVGILSEEFRKLDSTTRSLNPIFSVSTYGKYKNDLQNSSIYDCFSDESCFGILYLLNGKIINLACNFEVTFLHYVEQKINVSYRYLKKFEGFLINKGIKRRVETNYFVGNLDINYSMDLSKLKDELTKNNNFFESKLGRFNSYSVSCKDFKLSAEKLIYHDEYSLIKEN